MYARHLHVRSFRSLAIGLIVAAAGCQAGSDIGPRVSGTGQQSDNVPGSTGGTGGTDEADSLALRIDGTVPGRKLTVGGPAMQWPPAGVEAAPMPEQHCAVTLGSGNVLTDVPGAFYAHCAGCHGPRGMGSAGYPPIVGATSLAAFTQTLRNGKDGATARMPAFDAKHLPDADLQRIFAFLTSTPITTSAQCSNDVPLDADGQSEAIARGLAAWRKADATRDNVGCYQCHGPDGLAFAYFGFSDGDILRRASKHLGEADAFSVVDMVHGLRDRFAIARRDPFVARPFQPGGRLLPGASAAQRDLAFGKQLAQMGLTLANGYINTSAQATQAAAELGNINMHALPLPIAFNHLSEDVIHNTQATALDCSADIDTCGDHGAISDWMPTEPHVASNASTLFTVHDQYLASPNLTTFYQLWGATPAGTSMPGTYPISYNYDVDNNKYRSEFILDYCIRQELLGRPGCFDSNSFIFDANKHVTSIWGEGEYANLFGTGLSKQPTCDIGQSSCDPQQAPQFFANLSPGGKISDNMQRLRTPWFTMHWTHFDPTMLMTGDATIQQSEYFTRSIFWNNNDQDYGGKALSDTYSIFAVYQVVMHNIKVLQIPQASSCSKIPFTHPDLGVFTCTALDLRSGYFPQLCNFAEGKNWYNDSTFQLAYVPKDAERKALYQRLGGNMYRMFLRGLIHQLSQDNWMCDASMQQYRIKRAQAFLAQPEIVADNGPADQEMFSTLAALMAKSVKKCPPLSLTVPAQF